ncbi:MAG: FAD-dependent oxidoreductase, partial [Planctomycetes bacterium]|nr:FAD-dependent oxidoreductase [Planctomycetota bacterium]
MHSQLVVLGGGPGGYSAAFIAADLGMQVTLVEAEKRLGGTCLLKGCIPSKALLHVARVIAEVDELRADWGIEYDTPRIAVERVRARKEKVIKTLSTGLKKLAKARKVNLINARGVFENSTTLRLRGDDDSVPADGLLTFDHAILATGSLPVMPPAFDIGSDRVIDSSGALELVDIPETMLVIGGGYIGLEMGTVYAQLGTQVSVVEMLDGLLIGADRDLVKPLKRRLDALFDKRIFLNTKVGSLADVGGAVEVAFEGPGKFGT